MMSGDMGTFRTTIAIENPLRRGERRVLGEVAGDLILLGARSLEGRNLRVDARSKQLVDAGPIVAAVA
jgi:hypothetical protein